MKQAPLRLMCVLADPDDESLAMGGILTRYASEGIGTYLVMATPGPRQRLKSKGGLVWLTDREPTVPEMEFDRID